MQLECQNTSGSRKDEISHQEMKQLYINIPIPQAPIKVYDPTPARYEKRGEALFYFLK